VKKSEPQVLITTGIKGKQVFLKIDCPNVLTAARYLCIVNGWIERFEAKVQRQRERQIIENQEKGDD
jgi:hypothetical protein